MRIQDLFKLDNTEREYKQLVRVNFNYGYQSLEELHALESKLRMALYNKNIGEFDGHEISTDHSEGALYLYAHNAEELFKAIRAILLSVDFMKRADVYLRFGDVNDPDALEIELALE